jgi:hypothetical protein
MTDDPHREDQQDQVRPTGPVQGEDQARGSGPVQGGDPVRGRHRASGQGTATMSRQEQVRDAPPRTEYREPHRSMLPILLGLVGVLALGGLIAGLVVSHTPSTTTAAPTTRTLSNFVSRGDASGPAFTTPSSPITARYSYSCPAGTTGHFVAQFETAAGSAIRTIVSSSALSGSGSKTVTAPPPPCREPVPRGRDSSVGRLYLPHHHDDDVVAARSIPERARGAAGVCLPVPLRETA